MRPRIGITGSVRRAPFKRWIDALAILLAGGRPVSMRPDWPADVDALDGFVITGGLDVAAGVYAGPSRPHPEAGHDRDRFELALLDHAAETGKPVLGICRGAQLINVHAGGTLHPDVRESYPEAPEIRSLRPVRPVHVTLNTRLARAIGGSAICVNALHTQAVDSAGHGIVTSARDPFGIVQAVEGTGARFEVGVQWHPEWLVWRARHRAIYRAFIAAARAYAGARRRLSGRSGLA